MMTQDMGRSPTRRRRHGVWWIVASGLLLPAGWIAWLLVALAGYNGVDDSDRSLAGQTTGSAFVTLVCAGVPLTGAILLLVRRRRDRSVTLVGPVGCIVLTCLAAGSLGYPTVRVAQSWAADAHRRAQPLTALETSRTQSEAERDLADVGTRAVEALGEDVRAGQVDRYTRGCPLSNLQQGTEYRWVWSVRSGSSDGSGPDTDESDAKPSGDAAEIERRTAPVREVFRRAGLRDADPYGWDLRAIGGGWLREAYADTTKASGAVTVETTCFAGGPGDG
ncbi:hypothetical protein [Curtobacterium sp. 1544]|uniref:hypothetical protein n=1 Tax=Curtobacterium sp. 1544 TaxID=3156417 RepID=UPI0033929ECF